MDKVDIPFEHFKPFHESKEIGQIALVRLQRV